MTWTKESIINNNNSLQDNDHIYVITNFCRSQQSSIESAPIKSIINNYLDQEFSFRRSPHGRPYIVSNFQDVPLFISIAHSKDLLVVAISLDEAIGVDIEFLKPRSKTNLIARRYFGHEYEQFGTYSFYHHWCAREAYIKAVDGRLFRDLSTIKTAEHEHYLIGTKGLDHRVSFFEFEEDYSGAFCQHTSSKKGLLIRNSHAHT